MRVLFVTEFFPTGEDLKFSGGVEARTFFVAKHLAVSHQVSVICSRQSGSKAQEKVAGINVYRVGPISRYRAGADPLSVITVIRFISQAIKLGARLNIDIVDGGNFNGHFIAKQIAQKKKIPAVFWYPDVFLGQWLKTSGLVAGLAGALLEKFNLRRGADHFITISKVTSDKLQRNGVSSKKITYIPCGVELAEFKLKTEKSKVATIIAVARLVHYKRLEDLLRSFSILLARGIEASLLIVGRGPQEQYLRQRCQMLKIARRVSFLSNLPRVALIKNLKSSTVFCLPSEVEGFGLAIIEAAAAGIPYVVSDIAVFKEVTKNGRGGLLFRVGDPKDLAAKIQELLVDKLLYQKKVKEAAQLAKIYQWSQIVKETESVYKSLL